MTAQIIAFKLSDYVYIIIFAGFILTLLARKEKLRYVGRTILAFGLLFDGIDIMGSVMKPLASSPFFLNLIDRVADNRFLGVLVGMLMTLVVQSSSATIAVLSELCLTGCRRHHSQHYRTFRRHSDSSGRQHRYHHHSDSCESDPE
jgi:Na+/phosphate symporter